MLEEVHIILAKLHKSKKSVKLMLHNALISSWYIVECLYLSCMSESSGIMLESSGMMLKVPF